MSRMLLGFLLGCVFVIILLPIVGLAWLLFGRVPVAVADHPFPLERRFTGIPLHVRMDHEMIKFPPIEVNESNLEAGAQIYHEQCASCHGLPGKPSSIGQHMFPDAPALWAKHENSGVVGVSDDPPGETWWKVANGIRLTGMPSYKHLLTETQMWQVSLLLANADKPLSLSAQAILREKTVTPSVPPRR